MQRQHSVSKPTLIFAGLAIAAAFIAWLIFKSGSADKASHEAGVPASEEQSTSSVPMTRTAADDSELRAQSPSERSSAPHLPAVVQPISRPVAASAAPAPAVARPEPTPYTRQLVAGLTNLDFSRGPITKEQAEQWKQNLQTLTGQGAAALPAIREFLEQNQELNFGAMAGGDQLGQSSLRSAMINALAQIGGPDAQGLLLQTLQTTTLPSEVALLAQRLEEQAPGQYRQDTISAINEILAMGGKGQLPEGWDVGALFQVLQKFGDPASVAALEQLQPQWRYYATISLAGLDGGAGLPALIREAQDPAAGGKRDFAYQMLAQAAAQYPDAAAALLEQARRGEIPDAAWRKIATGLAGDQYQLGSPPAAPAASGTTVPGLKTYHIASGNQNFYSLPVPPDGQSQRMDLINQLLGATSNPAAVAALQSAQGTLTANVAPR